MFVIRGFRSSAGRSAALILACAAMTGCEPAVRDEFRAAALGSVQTGVNAILQGLVDGIFAVAEPEGDSGTGGTGGTGGETSTQ